MGWVVGFEPTYTGATTLGLNRLTIPTILTPYQKIGDLERARTCDPLLVRQMLSQLS